MTATVDAVTPAICRFPTPTGEADGTLAWDATTAVTCTIEGGGCSGLGWTYSSPAAATIISEHLAPVVAGSELTDVAGIFARMRRACRNIGTRGLVMQAISAIGIALWDLRARVLQTSVGSILGGSGSVRVYGSGGFTTFTDRLLADQVEGRLAAVCTAMKIKIGESWGARESGTWPGWPGWRSWPAKGCS